MLLFGFLFSEGGLNCRPDTGQQVLRTLGVGSVRSQFKVFLQGLGRTRRSDRLIALQSRFPEQVYPFLIIGVGAVRVRSNALVERGIGVIDTAGIRIDRSNIEIRRGSLGGIGLGRGFVTL